MTIIIFFSNNARPTEYADSNRLTPKKGDAYRGDGFTGKIVASGVQNIGGILQRFIEVTIQKEEPWVELGVIPEKNVWTRFVEKEKSELYKKLTLTEFVNGPQKNKLTEHALLTSGTSNVPSPNFHEEF